MSDLFCVFIDMLYKKSTCPYFYVISEINRFLANNINYLSFFIVSYFSITTMTEASNKAFSTPPSLNFFKHSIMLHLLIPTLSAIASIEMPSTRNRNILALHIVCACIVLACVCNSRYEPWSSVSVIVFAFRP